MGGDYKILIIMNLGNNEIYECYLGAAAITEAYLGDVLVFSNGPFEGLKASPKTVNFNAVSLTSSIKVKSSEAWTMTLPSWISADTLTGDTGETIVSLTATTQASATADTISIVSANYNATVTVNFSMFNTLSYIYARNHSAYIPANHIDTGVANVSTATTIEIEYYGLGGNSDRMVGYQQGDAGCTTDSADFRVFGYQNGTFDYMNQRYYTGSINSGYHHLEIGNCYCKDVENDAMLAQGTVESYVPSGGAHILVDISYIKVKSVKIKDGNTVLFDGVAAEFNGNYGLYDMVSNQLFYNADVTMDYDV